MFRKTLIITVALTVILGGIASADTIAQWNFNNQTTSPQIGAGALSFINGAAAAGFVSQSGSSDSASGYAYNTNNINADGRGIEFAVSTSGYKDILVSWDWKRSSTANSSWILQYFDGSSWQTGKSYTVSTSNFENGNNFDFAGTSSADNNSAFAFRLLTVGSVGTASSTMRYDMVTVNGTNSSAVPEPGSMAALLSGIVGFIGLAGRKK